MTFYAVYQKKTPSSIKPPRVTVWSLSARVFIIAYFSAVGSQAVIVVSQSLPALA